MDPPAAPQPPRSGSSGEDLTWAFRHLPPSTLAGLDALCDVNYFLGVMRQAEIEISSEEIFRFRFSEIAKSAASRLSFLAGSGEYSSFNLRYLLGQLVEQCADMHQYTVKLETYVIKLQRQVEELEADPGGPRQPSQHELPAGGQQQQRQSQGPQQQEAQQQQRQQQPQQHQAQLVKLQARGDGSGAGGSTSAGGSSAGHRPMAPPSSRTHLSNQHTHHNLGRGGGSGGSSDGGNGIGHQGPWPSHQIPQPLHAPSGAKRGRSPDAAAQQDADRRTGPSDGAGCTGRPERAGEE